MELLKKHQIELDEDSEKLIAHIIDRGIGAKNLQGTILTKDWFISETLRQYRTARDGSTKQRALEYLAELTGVYVRDNKGNANTIADVTIGALNEK